MWASLTRFFSSNTERAATFDIERRAADACVSAHDWFGMFDSATAASGILVTRQNALSVPAIWSAVNRISQTLASLPFSLYRVTESGSQPAKGHPAYFLTKYEPSPAYSSYDFRVALFAQACFGDAYAIVRRNGIGRPSELVLVDRAEVTLFQRDTGQYYYVVRHTVGTQFREEVVLPGDMIHIKGLTLDGTMGQDVTRVHRDSIGMSIASEQYGNYFFANGASPSGAVVYPGQLTKEQRQLAESKIQAKSSGLPNTGKVMVLDAGVKFEKMSLNPGEAMLNETRNFQVNQAARIFGVPVPLLEQLDKATLNNMETMGIQFVNLCLRPWAVQVEQEFARKLLTYDERRSENYYFRFNFNGLLRGDTKARGEYYRIALGGPSTGIGFMSVNEVRELENLDRIEEGDDVFTADALAKMQSNGQQEMAGAQTDQPAAQENTNDDGTPKASN